MAAPLTVMAELDPAIYRGTSAAWMAGSSPAMTIGSVAMTIGSVAMTIGSVAMTVRGVAMTVSAAAMTMRSASVPLDLTDEGARACFLRRAENLRRGAGFDHLPLIHEQHTIGGGACEAHLVRYHHHGHAALT